MNVKAGLWLKGRAGLLNKIQLAIDTQKSHIWFHFASLGEFEQGRTLLERIKKESPEKKIVVTFFSPSGYEVRKNYALADHVFYLPLDTPNNAEKFIELINPEFAVFTKYDYWLNYFLELKKRHIKLYVISAIFYPQYSFFKWYGALNRRMLKLVTLIFVQDHRSKDLLQTIGIDNVIVNGDTRFDRVAENASNAKSIPIVEKFVKGSMVLVAGSTWPEDDKLLAELASNYPDWKLIVAPHEVDKPRIEDAKRLFGNNVALFSQFADFQLSDPAPDGLLQYSQILLIDNIGLLSSLYQYGNLGYIGGGFGVGIHNTLEAAAFDLPVIFGPNYERFREAVDLKSLGAAYPVSSMEELKDIIAILQDNVLRTESGKRAGSYVKENTGATAAILEHILF